MIKNTPQVCNQCHNQFYYKSIRKYCSKICYNESMRLHVNCQTCDKEINNIHSTSMRKRKYCSVKCAGLARQNKQLSKEWRTALSEGRKKSDKCKGENLYNWKGGKKTELQRFRLHNQKRRTSLKLSLDKLFLEALLIAQKNKCYYCNTKFNNNYAIDHLTPVSKGGDNQNYNLILCCKACNSKKHDWTLEDYSIKNNMLFAMKWDYIYSTALVIKDKLKEQNENK